MSAVFGVAMFCLAIMVAGRAGRLIKLLINRMFDWLESKIL